MCKLQVLYLIFLLFFSQINSRKCIIHLSLWPNRSINITNIGYPQQYSPGTSCSYLLKAPANHVINIDCSFKVFPNSCQSNYLNISLDGDMTFDGAERICRTALTISRTSYFQSLALSYESKSKWTHQRAQLSCRAVARSVPCDCGWSQAKRIANGVQADRLEFPFMAALLVRNSKNIICGGSIISDRYIVTAAHCTRPQRDLVALVGVHDLSKRSQSRFAREHSILGIIEHPCYNSLTDDNDIALLLTKVSIEWSRGVAPICLPFKADPYNDDNRIVDVAGWGTMGFTKKTSKTLQKATLKTMMNAFCGRHFNKPIPGNQVCTFDSDTKGRDSCQYDSGGPLIQRLRQRMFLFGVISYGQNCGLPYSVGVNTRISSHLPWIQKYVGNSVCSR